MRQIMKSKDQYRNFFIKYKPYLIGVFTAIMIGLLFRKEIKKIGISIGFKEEKSDKNESPVTNKHGDALHSDSTMTENTANPHSQEHMKGVVDTIVSPDTTLIQSDEFDSVVTSEDDLEGEIDTPGSTMDTLVPEEVEREEAQQHTEIATGNNYHIIGAAFGVKGNADRYVSTMIGKGYSARIIGQNNELYYVSIESFKTKKEALKRLDEVSDEFVRAWVYKI